MFDPITATPTQLDDQHDMLMNYLVEHYHAAQDLHDMVFNYNCMYSKLKLMRLNATQMAIECELAELEPFHTFMEGPFDA